MTERQIQTRRADRMQVKSHKGRAKVALAHEWFGLHVLLDRDEANEICASIQAVFAEVAND